MGIYLWKRKNIEPSMMIIVQDKIETTCTNDFFLRKEQTSQPKLTSENLKYFIFETISVQPQ